MKKISLYLLYTFALTWSCWFFIIVCNKYFDTLWYGTPLCWIPYTIGGLAPAFSGYIIHRKFSENKDKSSFLKFVFGRKIDAKIILNPFEYANKAYELTSNEALTFAEMSEKLSAGLGTTITYTSPNLFSFYWEKRKEKMPFAFILVMIMLHYLPRFQKIPAITEGVKKIIGRKPITFERFVEDNKTLLI